MSCIVIRGHCQLIGLLTTKSMVATQDRMPLPQDCAVSDFVEHPHVVQRLTSLVSLHGKVFDPLRGLG